MLIVIQFTIFSELFRKNNVTKYLEMIHWSADYDELILNEY